MMRAVRLDEKLYSEYLQQHYQGSPLGTKKKLSEILGVNSWAGQRCFVIGGGASLRDFDFSLLENELTIGVNKIYRVFEPTILFFADRTMYDEIEPLKIKSIKVAVDYTNACFDNVYYVRSAGTKGVGMDIDTLYTGNNSGFGALNLALVLGAEPIYLLGFDYVSINGKYHVTNDWGKIQDREYQDLLDTFRQEFQVISQHIDTKIINLSLKSALECWPKMRIEEVFNG